MSAKLLNEEFELSSLHQPNDNVNKDTWNDYVGDYNSFILSEADGKACVMMKGDSLYLRIYRADIPLYPLSESQFFTKDRFQLIEFK